MALSKCATVTALVCCLAGFALAAPPFAPVLAENSNTPKATANAPTDDCLQASVQLVRTSPERRLAACSDAIQSGKLSPSEMALARLNRGIARMAMGDKGMANVDYEEALKHYDSLLDPQKIDAMVLYRRGVALDALGQTDRALAAYNEATRLGPQFAGPFFERGLLLATRKGEFGRAIADFDKVLDLAPNDIDALILRGDAYRQMGDIARAMADLDRAVALAPANHRGYFFRGLANSRRGEKLLALADYDKAITIYPNYADALVSRSAIYAADGKEDLALHDLDTAIAVQTNNPIAFYNRGYVHFAKREYDLAVADYDAAIGLDPKMGSAYGNRCLVRAITGKDLLAALSDCDVALKLMPTNADVRETRGFIYMKLGEPLVAIVEYNAALESDPNRTIALFGRGMARIKAGQQKEGEADQAAARALAPAIEAQFSMYGLK
jgi:tetratricopeptide (TPR) repeat protein